MKKVVVYTTAENTKLRIAQTETFQLVDFSQPKETQPCIFVDTTKTIQTFVGIGDAFTVASAEAFAKLPKDKQQEFLQHYYAVNKGIGYLLIRTTKAYQDEGIPVWDLTVQNELMAVQTRESCVFTGEEERDFIKKFLGPTLQKAGMSNKKRIAWDHNRDLLFQRASTVLNDPFKEDIPNILIRI